MHIMSSESNQQFESAQRAIRFFNAAAEANLATPSRQGHIVRVSSQQASDVMVTADLHGHRANFARILKIAELERNPKRHLILQEVCHGGPQYDASPACRSHEMLQAVAQLKARYPERVHFILSNHELAEATNFPIQKQGRLLNLTFLMGLQKAYGSHALPVHEACRRFIASCPLAIVLPGEVWVSHSTPEGVDRVGFDMQVFGRKFTPDDLREDGDVFRLVWGRDYRQQNIDVFCQLTGAELFINGHTPCIRGFEAPNRRQLILDCSGELASYVVLSAQARHRIESIVDQVRFLSSHATSNPAPADAPSRNAARISEEDRFLLNLLRAELETVETSALCDWWQRQRHGDETFAAFLERHAISNEEAAAGRCGYTKLDLVGGLFDPAVLARLRAAVQDVCAGGGGANSSAVNGSAVKSPATHGRTNGTSATLNGTSATLNGGSPSTAAKHWIPAAPDAAATPSTLSPEDQFLIQTLESAAPRPCSRCSIATWWLERRQGNEPLAAFLERRAISPEDCASGKPGFTKSDLVGSLFDPSSLERLSAAIQHLISIDAA